MAKRRPWAQAAGLPFLVAAVAFALPARAEGELDRARDRIRSGSAQDRLHATRLLSQTDHPDAVKLLGEAVRQSQRDMAKLGVPMDRLDAKYVKKRSKVVNREWSRLEEEFNRHLQVLRDAGRTLGLYREPATIKAIGQGAVGEKDPYLRQLYVAALGTVGRAEGIPFLLGLVDEKDPRVRAAAARALRPFAARKVVVDRVRPLAEDKCWSVRLATYETMARAPLDVALPFLIQAATREKGEIARICDDLLASRTGQHFAHGLESWSAWWREHEAEVRSGAFVERDAADHPRPEGDSRPAFFDIPIDSLNVSFLIDYSSSMDDALTLQNPYVNRTREEFGLPATRLGYAKAELIRALRRIPDGATFDIIVYGNETHRFAKTPTRLTPGTRRRAVAWLLKQDPEALTNIWAALSGAYRDCLAGGGGASQFTQVADTVVLLTDGNPTIGRIRLRAPLVEVVRMWNWAVGASVICIGLGGRQDGKLLGAFAEATHGLYVDLRKPVREAAHVRRRVLETERTPPVAPRLAGARKQLAESDAEGRRAALETLAELGGWAEPAAGEVARALGDRDSGVRAAADRALVAIRPAGKPR